MRKVVVVALLGWAACQPNVQPAVIAAPVDGASARADSCRDDIPDCAAACALRETHRTDFIDFYDRRCAAVVLGKNPDKVEMLQPTPYANAAPAASGSATASSEFPPESRAPLRLQAPPSAPFDPTAVSRTGTAEPAECKAARMLRAQNRAREAEMLDALCVAKGGDAGI